MVGENAVEPLQRRSMSAVTLHRNDPARRMRRFYLTAARCTGRSRDPIRSVQTSDPLRPIWREARPVRAIVPKINQVIRNGLGASASRSPGPFRDPRFRPLFPPVRWPAQPIALRPADACLPAACLARESRIRRSLAVTATCYRTGRRMNRSGGKFALISKGRSRRLRGNFRSLLRF
jgi:hypothetical protein